MIQGLTERQAAQRAQIDGQREALNLQRSELQAQQGTLLRRRNQLDEQRQGTPGSQRAGIDAQIAEIDARSANIDKQLTALDAQVAAAMARRTAIFAAQEAGQAVGGGTQVIRIPEISIPPIDMRRSRGMDGRDVAGFMLAEALLLGAMGVVAWRSGMRRMREQVERMFASQAQQMNQLQQSMDVVGIEVERISEAQRYVAKVLTDGSKAQYAFSVLYSAEAPCAPRSFSPWPYSPRLSSRKLPPALATISPAASSCTSNSTSKQPGPCSGRS